MILAIGEALVDLIADQPGALAAAESFSAFPGGSVTNLAIGVAGLGHDSGLAAALGTDGEGDLVADALARAGVNSQVVRLDHPTTTVHVSSGRGTPEFELTRGADRHFDHEVHVEGATAVHTSAFALSLDPLRTRCLDALRAGQAAGALTSIDLNFSSKVWGVDARTAGPALADATALSDVVKCSVDDLERIFGDGWRGEMLFDWGNPLVVITAGRERTTLLDNGRWVDDVPVPPAPVVDTTGAGDAFWAGFLTSYLAGERQDPITAIEAGHASAAIKLGRKGPLLDDSGDYPAPPPAER